jgi:hypothetical protein
MTVDFSVLSNRSVTGVGAVFTAGHYIKCPFLIPSNGILSANLKALVYQEQAAIFSEIEELDGVVFEKEGSLYFNEDSIHESVIFDPNKLAIWLDFKNQQAQGTDKPRVIIPVSIYITPGKGSPEAQVKRSDAYIRAIINLLTVTPNQFLVVGYPATIPAGYTRSNLQPEVKIQFKFDSNPDAQGTDGNAARPIGQLNFDIQLVPKHNIIPTS